MNIVEQSVTLWPIPVSAEETLRHIERAGRVCYKSEDKITDVSAEKFIQNIIKRGHESVLEHGNIILSCNKMMYKMFQKYQKIQNRSGQTVYLRFSRHWDRYPAEERFIVSGNIRAWRACIKFFVEECCMHFDWMLHFVSVYDWAFFDFQDAVRKRLGYDANMWAQVITVKDLKYDSEYLTHMCVTQTAVVDRGITHELVRHRPASYSQESTRYCNYAKGKFGSAISVIDPGMPNSLTHGIWLEACCRAEQAYNDLIEHGVKPQIARSVLPTCLKAELVITANLRELLHMINLRGGEGAHPQAIQWARETRRLLDESYPDIDIDQLERMVECGC